MSIHAIERPEPYGHVGIFHIRKVMTDVSNNKSCIQQLTFENHAGEFTGIVVPGPLTQTMLMAGMLAELSLNHPLHGTDGHYRIYELRAVSSYAITNGAELLPGAQTPWQARDALAKLVKLNEHLTQPALKHFLTQVLLDPDIGPVFARCKASLDHHHNSPGGLVAHSVEVAIQAAKMVKDRLSREEVETTVVAALMHDVGKLWTVEQGTPRPSLGRFVRHEFLTLAVLARHLEVLKQHWPEGAEALCSLWDFQNRHSQHQGPGSFLGAECLAVADQLSVNRNLEEMQEIASRKKTPLKVIGVMVPGEGYKPYVDGNENDD